MGSGKFSAEWWTKERVDNGLQRFIRDFYEEQGAELPANYSGYKALVTAVDSGKYRKDRAYPPVDAVLRFYETIAAAWWAFGFLVEVKAKEKKYVFTEEMDARLREIYAFRFGSKERPAGLPGPKEYARSLDLPEFVMTRRAQELGLSFTKEPAWTPAELKLLEQYGYRTPKNLRRLFKQHGFDRTETSIGLMRKRRAVHKASPYFSMNAVAVLFGVDGHLVKRWLTRGWLKFIMKGKPNDPKAETLCGDTHLIHKDWIFDFIAEHPDAFNLKNVDQLWFLHVVTRGAVKLAFSKPGKIGKRTEAQQIEEPIEFRKSVIKKQMKGRPAGLASTEKLAENKPHGTRIKYMAGCRCPECRKANTDYEKNRCAARKNGESNDLVPAEFARNHLAFLSEQGVGYKTAAKAAGVAASVVMKITSGDRVQIRVNTEQKLLGVTAEAIAPGTLVDAREMRRQIEWLIANGLTKTKLALELGSQSKTPALQLRKDRTTKATADKVRALYENYYADFLKRQDAGSRELAARI